MNTDAKQLSLALTRKTYRLLKEEPPVVSKWQLNPHLSQRGGSRSWLQTVLSNLPSGSWGRNS
jgi:hypothetical protein